MPLYRLDLVVNTVVDLNVPEDAEERVVQRALRDRARVVRDAFEDAHADRQGKGGQVVHVEYDETADPEPVGPIG